MISEGLLAEGMSVSRAIHDRYNAAKRNPYNEIECSDHYSRSMASYGAFLAACGFEHHGPKGHLAFAPGWQGDNFKVAFTAAGAWGSYTQKRAGTQLAVEVSAKWGRLRLKTLGVVVPDGVDASKVNVTLDGVKIVASTRANASQTRIEFAEDVVIETEKTLRIAIG